MTDRLQYGTTAKVFHWLVVALLLVQYPIGWLMPDIHGGMKSGRPHDIPCFARDRHLALIILRFTWRLTHPVGAGEFATTLATLDLRSRALGCSMRWYWRPPSPAGCSRRFAAGRCHFFISSRCRCWPLKMRRRESDRWLASDDGMDAAGIDRHSCGGGDGSHLHLPRPYPATDAAGIAIIGTAIAA